MTITLETIKTEHAKVGEMIAIFERQATTTKYAIPSATITLGPGERYAGIVLDDEGEPAHHLILLPGDKDGSTWSDAKVWATQQGGELPTRREQSLLYANLKGEFQQKWYWSAETYESDKASAWCQLFNTGGPDYGRKDSSSCRARAVRRLVIQ
jgi:hypothetical protein